jgi:hypothetical protein
MDNEIESLLSRLPDIADFPALRDVQCALWGVGEARGAAVMVGAGFSINAERASGSTPLPPLWKDFTRRMALDLYPSAPEMAVPDPLRLAEEYRAALGQPALDAMIRELVTDRLWTPGQLHRELIALPWADVLTTNWDTLLERAAAEEHDRAYEVVETVDAIARTRSPRIVKLHGSLPSHRPFIFAAEDYRTYPRRFSPFVNLARQVLLENEMVLIGFSGDDPNFLQWTGWVRDQLGASARRIRLVGVLGLSTARRRLLESQNVTPIDLEPLVRELDPGDRHRVASQVLLASLRGARPKPVHHWQRDSEALEQDPGLARLLETWAGERRNYPGWILAPAIERYRVRFGMERHLARLSTDFSQLDIALRGALAREIVWRCDVSLWDLPSWLTAELGTLIADPKSGLDRTARLDAYLALAADARRRRDWDACEGALEGAETEARSGDDRAAISYERCLEARDRLDYESVFKLIPDIDGADPAWALRRASMQAFVLDRRGAVQTALGALQEIRRRRARDRGSVWLLSREAWAHLIVRNGWFDLSESRMEDEEWPHRYREYKCDPWDEFTYLDHELERRGETSSSDGESGFDPGPRIRHRGRGGWSSSANLRPYDELSRAIDKAGFARLPGVNVVDERLQRAALLLGDDRQDSWSVLRTIRDWSKGIINDRYDRVTVARMDIAVVEEQVDSLRTAVDFGRVRLVKLAHRDGEERQTHWIEQLRLMIELLSRLAIRLSSARAIDLFDWAHNLTLDRNLDHWWLFQPLGNLLNRSFDAVDPAARDELAFKIFQIPLPGERPLLGIDRYWPELATRLDDDNPLPLRDEPAWRDRIKTIISFLGLDSSLTRSRALVRIYVLNKRGALSADEAAEAADAIWAVKSREESELPDCPDLMPHILLELPEPARGTAENAFRGEIMKRIGEGRASHIDYESLGSAVDASRPVRLSSEEAATAAEQILSWNPLPSSEDDELGLHDREQSKARAYALARAILPVICDSKLTDELADRIFDLVSRAPAFVEALPSLVARIPGLAKRGYREIRRQMVSRDLERAYSAWIAVHQWMELADKGNLQLPTALIQDVTAAVAARREPALLPSLQRAAELVANRHMTEAQLGLLAETLDVLHADTAYTNQDRDGLRSDTFTLVRAASVQLAKILENAGVKDEGVTKWTSEVSKDPVPEVRYALVLPLP